MAIRNASNRNLWIIAALVAVTIAALVWFFGMGGGAADSLVADVSIEAPPGSADTNDRGDSGMADVVSDALVSPPVAGDG